MKKTATRDGSVHRTEGPPMRVLRFPEAANRDPGIDAWLDRQPTELRPLARTCLEKMRACGDDVRELMHDGAPTAYVHDAAFGYVSVFRTHMNVGLFNGAILEDCADLLEGDGRFMRHVKMRPGAEPDSSALSALIVAAYRDMKARAPQEPSVDLEKSERRRRP